MRVVIQRAESASVTLAETGFEVSSIGRGLLLLVGLRAEDTEVEAAWLADRVLGLKLWDDGGSAWKRSVVDVGGSILSVSQFTLYAKTKKRKPDFHDAMGGPAARVLYERFVETLRVSVDDVKDGVFGEHMRVSLVNDGPVTITIDTETMPPQPPLKGSKKKKAAVDAAGAAAASSSSTSASSSSAAAAPAAALSPSQSSAVPLDMRTDEQKSGVKARDLVTLRVVAVDGVRHAADAAPPLLRYGDIAADPYCRRQALAAPGIPEASDLPGTATWDPLCGSAMHEPLPSGQLNMTTVTGTQLAACMVGAIPTAARDVEQSHFMRSGTGGRGIVSLQLDRKRPVEALGFSYSPWDRNFGEYVSYCSEDATDLNASLISRHLCLDRDKRSRGDPAVCRTRTRMHRVDAFLKNMRIEFDGRSAGRRLYFAHVLGPTRGTRLWELVRFLDLASKRRAKVIGGDATQDGLPTALRRAATLPKWMRHRVLKFL